MATKKEIFLFTTAFLYRLLIFLALMWWSSQAGFDYPLQGSDARGYWNLATNITQGEPFFATHEGSVEFLRPPGYPVYLSMFRIFFGNTASQYTAVIVQITLTAFAVMLLYRLLIRAVSEKTAHIAALFFALEPNSAYYSTLLLSDALFVFLLVASAYLLLTRFSYSMYLFSGFLLGAAMLVRPIAQFFPAIAVLFLFYARGFERKTIVSASAFLLGSLLLPLPWMTHTENATGNFMLSSSGPNTYYKYVMPQFISWQTGQSVEAVREEFLARLDTAVAHSSNTAVFMQTEINSIISEHIASYAVYHGIKTIPFFVGDGIREILQKIEILNEKQPNISTMLLSGKLAEVYGAIRMNPYLLIAVAGGLFWSIILLCSCVGFWHGIRQNTELRRIVIFFALVILYLTILTGPPTSTRHRMPALPFLAGLAAMGFYELYDKQKPNHTKRISSPEFLRAENQPQT